MFMSSYFWSSHQLQIGSNIIFGYNIYMVLLLSTMKHFLIFFWNSIQVIGFWEVLLGFLDMANIKVSSTESERHTDKPMEKYINSQDFFFKFQLVFFSTSSDDYNICIFKFYVDIIYFFALCVFRLVVINGIFLSLILMFVD